jgi:hypothetical protein
MVQRERMYLRSAMPGASRPAAWNYVQRPLADAMTSRS